MPKLHSLISDGTLRYLCLTFLKLAIFIQSLRIRVLTARVFGTAKSVFIFENTSFDIFNNIFYNNFFCTKKINRRKQILLCFI